MIEDPVKLQKLINEMVTQAISKLESGGYESSCEKESALVLLPEHVSDPKLLSDYINKNYQNARVFCPKECIAEGKDYKNTVSDDENSRQRIMASLDSFGSVVLAFPAVNVLKKIAVGQDERFAEAVVTKAILKNKDVVILLDFSLQQAARSKWLKDILSAVKEIEEAGAQIVSLTCTCEDEANALELITEADVESVYKSGAKVIRARSGAVVTPLARDKAGELGIEIEILKEQ